MNSQRPSARGSDRRRGRHGAVALTAGLALVIYALFAKLRDMAGPIPPAIEDALTRG